MADLLKWAKDRAANVVHVAQGVERQVNPWDNGASYSNPTPAPRPPVQSIPQNNNRSIISKVWDQANPFDSGRSFHQSTPTNYRSTLGQISHNGITNTVGNFVVKPFVINPAQNVIETGRAISAEATNNVPALQASQHREWQNAKESLPGMAANVLWKTGDVLKNTPRAVQADVMGGSLLPQTGNSAVDKLGFAATNPVGAFMSLTGHKAHAPTQGQQKAIDTGLASFQQTPMGQVASPVEKFAANRNADVKQTLKQAGYNPDQGWFKSTVLDPASGVLTAYGLAEGGMKLAGAAKPGLVAAADTAKGMTPTAMAENHPAVQALNDHLNLLNSARDRMAANGLSEGHPSMVNNAKAYANTLAEKNATIQGITQGGYVQVPGGKNLTPGDIPSSSAASKGGKGKKPLDIPVGPQIPNTSDITPTPAMPVPKAGELPAIPGGEKPLGVSNTVETGTTTTKGLKNAISGDYTPLTNKEAIAAADKRIAEDPGSAYQFAISNHSAEGNVTAIKIAKHYEAQGRPDLAAELMVEKAKQALNAGQGNQVYSLWDKLSPETIGQTAAKQIEKFNATATKKIPGLTPEQYKGFVDEAKRIQQMGEGRDKNFATQKLQQQIARLTPSPKGDKAFAIWRTGLLTGFRTPGKILVSHAISNIFEQAKNVPAAITDMGISKITGERSMSLTPKGLISGGGKGGFAAVDNLLTGYDAPGTGGFPKDYANSTHFSDSLHGRVAEGYVNVISRLHGSLYKPFYGAQHLNSLFDMATTNAKNAGLKGAERTSYIQDFVKQATDYSVKNTEGNPHADFSTPEGAALRANAEAQYTTFQNKTALSEAAAGTKKGLPGVKYVAPFTQIPSSIAMKIIDYSPVGPIKEAIQQAHAGSLDQRTLVQAIGRGTTGTGIMALGAALYNNGLLTTAYPASDKKLQAQWQLEGKQENSVKIGGKWLKLSSFGPSGDALAVGGNFAQGMKGDKKTPGGIAGAIVKGGAGGIQTVAQSPYLQGLDSVSQGLNDPQGKATGIFKQYAGTIVPTGIGNIATATDPLQRQNNNVVDAVKNKIPSLSEKSLPKVDVFGQEQKRQQGVIPTLIDPFYSTTAKSTDVTKELNRLITKNLNSTPAPESKAQNILGQPVTLNPEQLTQLQKETGVPIGQKFAELMATPEYKNASDQAKQNALDQIVKNVRQGGKVDFALGKNVPSANSTSGQPQNNPAPSSSVVDMNKLTKDAQLTLAKDSFDKSGKSYQQAGDTILRRDATGTITATPKTKYDYQVGTANLVAQKGSGDINGWMSTAQSQLDSIKKQLADPSIDPLESIQLRNDAAALNAQIDKYTQYGGFTKPKKGKSAKSISSRKFGKGFNVATSNAGINKLLKAGSIHASKVAVKKGAKSPKIAKIPKSRLA